MLCKLYGVCLIPQALMLEGAKAQRTEGPKDLKTGAKEAKKPGGRKGDKT